MAKGNALMGMLRGKVGDVVFSRLKGEQISRAYNAQVSNPRTVGQALQRAIFATVTHTAMYLSKVVESSFDGYKNGQESRNAFIKENVALLRSIYETEGGANLLLNPKGNNLGAPNRLKISKGNQGFVTPSLLDSNDLLGWDVDSSEISDGVSAITFGSLKSVFPSLAPGTQLTFVSLVGARNNPASWRWRVSRIVFSPFITDDSLVFSDQGQVYNTAIVLEKSEGLGGVSEQFTELFDTSSAFYAFAGSEVSGVFLGASPNENSEYYAIAGGAIVSNYNSAKGVWEHSDSELYTQFNLDWDSLDDVLATYQNAAKVASASDWYTEQAQAEPTNTIYSTLNQAFQGQFKANGLAAKAINFEAVNSYGPIVEGNAVFFTIEPNAGVNFNNSSLQVLIGETAVQPAVTSYADGSYRYAVTVPFGTANSVSMNVTFNCDYGYGTRNVGFRTTISKVQA